MVWFAKGLEAKLESLSMIDVLFAVFRGINSTRSQLQEGDE